MTKTSNYGQGYIDNPTICINYTLHYPLHVRIQIPIIIISYKKTSYYNINNMAYWT